MSLRTIFGQLALLFNQTRFILELEVLRWMPFSWLMKYFHVRSYLVFPCLYAVWRLTTIRPGYQKIHDWNWRTSFFLLHRRTVWRFMRLLVMTRQAADLTDWIDLQGQEHLDQALREGKGVVLLTSHLGLPNLLRWYLRSQDYQVLHLYKMKTPQKVTSFKSFFELLLLSRYHLNEENLIGDEQFSLQYMKRTYHHLRQNGVLNISGDGTHGDRRLTSTVMSRECSFATGGLSLGVMTGAQIIPCFSDIDLEGRIRIQIQHPLHYALELPREAQLNELVHQYAARIESRLKEYPTFSNYYLFAQIPQIEEQPEKRAA